MSTATRHRPDGARDDRFVRVRAPGRLHLGFLDLNGGLGRRFGSLGLAIDGPATSIVVRRAPEIRASGPESRRAATAAVRVADAFGLNPGHDITVIEAIPAHAGLGSGTQLALAVGCAMLRLEGTAAPAQRIGDALDRGARSAIGMAAFDHGGFIVDGGRGAGDHPPPVVIRTPFPDDWRILLVLDRNGEGVHGDREAEAFANLSPFPAERSGHLCRLVMMRLAPALIEHDLASFGAAVTEIQSIVGGHFAAQQGGRMWTSPAVETMIGRLAAAGAVGIGQSSWGPTGFAFLPSEAAALTLYRTFVDDAKAMGLEILVARGRNAGAEIEERTPDTAQI
jgi:beta-RFAP synthase